jgi:hypothetical protein
MKIPKTRPRVLKPFAIEQLDRSPKKAEPYKLSVYRIFELLSDRQNSAMYKNTLTQARFKLNSARRLQSATGISNTVVHNLLARQKEGAWVELQQETYIRLAYLLQVIEPALIDPLDPEKEPIRFGDRLVGGLFLRGWQQLKILHEESAPAPQDVLLKQFWLSEKEDQKLDREDLAINAELFGPKLFEAFRLASEKISSGNSSEDGFMAFSCAKLSALVKADMQDLSLEEYVEDLVESEFEGTQISRRDAENLKASMFQDLAIAIPMILGGTIPSGDAYRTSMRVLARQLEGFNGNIAALVSYCQD